MRACPGCGEDNPDRARFCLGCGRSLDAQSGESRRLVTTLFCDLVGSTELGAKLDAETYHRVISRFYEATRAVIDRHEGTLEKFVGDAVMAVFGFPHLREDDAARAVRAAWELTRVTEELNDDLGREWGVRLGIRTGIATGEVLAGAAGSGEPFVIGSSVNLAARLEQRAEPGQILLDDATARRVRREAAVEPLPPIALKGFGEDTATFLLTGLAPSDARPRPREPLVDRVAERRMLEEALRGSVEARRCRVANVIGDAGVGKTRLVEAFVESPPDATVLWGRCPSPGEGDPFRALAEIVAQAADVGPDAPPGALAVSVANLVGDETLAGRLLATAGLSSVIVTPEERGSSVRSFLATLARERPVVVVIDDVHRASAALFDVLQHVVEWTRDASILLVGIGRPELFFDHPSWARLRGRLTLHLDPLGENDGAILAGRLLPDAPADVERRIVEIAGGNPFFIEEIAASLREAGGELAPERVPVPSTITALLQARVDRLDEPERQALEGAAVLGIAFTEPDLEPFVGPEVHDVLGRLADRDLVLPDRDAGPAAWRFRHTLIRDAAYTAIPKARRADLHVAVAARLADDVRAGFHLEQAVHALRELGSRSPSLLTIRSDGGHHLAAAGRAASSRGDVGSAADLLERAAGLLTDDDLDRLPVLADLHRAQLYAGRIDRAKASIEELVAAFGPDDDGLLALRARLMQAHLRFLVDPAAMPPASYRPFLDAAAARFEEEDDTGSLAAALADMALVAWVEGRADDMVTTAERALEAAERSGALTVLHEAAALLAAALLRGRMPLVEALTRLGDVRGRLAADRLTGATLRLTEAMMLLRVGRIDDARGTLDVARTTFEDLGQRRWLAAADDVEAELLRVSGRAAEAISRKREVYAFFLEQGDELNALPAAVDLAEFLQATGDLAEADLLASEVEARDTGVDLEIRVAWRTVRAAALAARGDAQGARRLAEEALRLADATDLVLLQADARASLAASGALPVETERLWDEALARFEAKGASADAARLRRDRGSSPRQS